MTRTQLETQLNRWGLRVFALAAALMILLFLASLALIYVGDEYAEPSWSTESVPAPRTY